MSRYESSFLPWRGGRYAKQGWELCLGSVKDTAHFAEDGATALRWGSEPTRAHHKQIRALRLVPNRQQLRRRVIPAFVGRLPLLEFLHMPLSFSASWDSIAVPPQLRSLMLTNSRDCHALLKKAESQPKRPWPRLKALLLFDNFDSTPVGDFVGFSRRVLPGLRLLKCSLHKGAQRLELISQWRQLRFVELHYVANQQVFEALRSPLRALSIVGTGRKFSLEGLAEMHSVEFLWLNGVKSPIDCQLFRSLPKLREINILNAPHLENVATLLECQKLQQLSVLACRRPFDRALKTRFEAHGFHRLEIAHA